MSDIRKDFVVIGEIAKPHGVKGEVRVHSHADSPSLFEGLEEVYLGGRRGRPRRFGVLAFRPHQGVILLTLAGVSDRNAAEELRGAEVLRPKEALPDPEEDELYMHEVLGMQVRLTDGYVLGSVESFDIRGDSEVWTVTGPDGEEILLPVADEFVVEVDTEAGYAVVDPPPGLLELYIEPGKKK
jgi:16S rRNA processing protein RimM